MKPCNTNILVAVSVCSTIFTLPAEALSLEKMLEYYVAPGNNTSLAPNQNLIGKSFSLRSSELSRRLNSEEKAGRLSNSESAKLGFELGRIRSDFERYRESDGGFSRGEAALIVQDFRRLSTRIDESVRRSRQMVSFTGINKRQSMLRNRVEEAVRGDELTRAEADSLRFSLQWTDQLKRELISKDGFTRANHDQLNSALTRVEQRLTRWQDNGIARTDGQSL